MVKKRYIPEQGDIVYFDFSPTEGREQTGSRPGLVLSRAFFNKVSGVAIVAPITSKQKGYPFEVPLHSKKVDGVALIDQIKAVDYAARNLKRISSVNGEVLQEAKGKFSALVE